MHCISRALRTKAKGIKNKSKESKDKVLRRYLRANRRIVTVEGVVEPVAVPVPEVAIPAKAADKEAAIRVAKNGSPEEDPFAFPGFGDQVLMLQQVVQDIGVEDWLFLKLFSEFISLDSLSVILAV